VSAASSGSAAHTLLFVLLLLGCHRYCCVDSPAPLRSCCALSIPMFFWAPHSLLFLLTGLDPSMTPHCRPVTLCTDCLQALTQLPVDPLAAKLAGMFSLPHSNQPHFWVTFDPLQPPQQSPNSHVSCQLVVCPDHPALMVLHAQESRCCCKSPIAVAAVSENCQRPSHALLVSCLPYNSQPSTRPLPYSDVDSNSKQQSAVQCALRV
jgi:hypothetical protein